MALFAMLALLVGVIPMVRAVRADASHTAPYMLSVSPLSASEASETGRKTFTFNVTITPPAAAAFDIAYRTEVPSAPSTPSDYAATGGSDYESVTGIVTVSQGQSTKGIPVVVLNDAFPEPSEKFNVVVFVAGHPTTTSTGTGTITNDDAAPPALSVNDIAVNEGDSGATPFAFTVTQSAVNAQPVDIVWQTAADSGASHAATAGTDYTTATNQNATIPAGQLSTTIRAFGIGDQSVERHETFAVQLLQASNASIADATGKATILDDDSPKISFADTVEGDDPEGFPSAVPVEAEGTRTFTLNLDAASGRTITANFATSDQTATAPNDYTAKSGTVTFVPGDTTEDVTVNVHDDTTPEATETFLLTLSGLVNATCDVCVATGQITEDEDALPSITVADVSVDEADNGTDSNVVFKVRLSYASGQVVSGSYATTDDTAASPGDYTAKTGTVTFPVGDVEELVTVVVKGDNAAEGHEKFKLTVSSPTNATCGDCVSEATIRDDETPTLSVVDAVGAEGNSPGSVMSFAVNLSAPLAQSVTLKYKTIEGTAKAISDYTAQNGTTVTIPANTSSWAIDVPLTSDTVAEPTENFSIEVTEASVVTIADGVAIGEISDEDGSPPTVSIADVTDDEAGDSGNMVFTVTWSAPAPGASVNWTTTDGTATSGEDFIGGTGVASYNPASTPASTTKVNIPLSQDGVDETSENFTITLSNSSNAAINDGVATGTITDDDGPEVTINDVSVTEGNAGTTNAVFAVSINKASVEEIKVDYTTSPDTASAGADYTTSTGTVTFPPNSTAAQTIPVPVVGDIADEPNEQFKVTLTRQDASRATLGDSEGIGTIIDDDGPAISIADAAPVTEGLSGTTNAVFNVTVSAQSAQVVTVDYTTVDQTATAPGDYATTTGTVTFPANSAAAQTINVPVNGDNIDEDNETFKVVLSNPTNANIADGEGVGTIDDDDSEPAMSIGDQSVTEGNTTAVPVTLTVTLSRPSSKAVSANYATADGTATAPGDYTAKSGTVAFDPGQTTKSITVLVAGDTAVENNETFFVDLTTPTNATLLDARGQATVVDNDTPAAAKQGYWMTGRDAGIFAFGDAKFHGSMGGQPLNQPIVGMAATPSGNGYWQVASDGGVFSWGDAKFYGSTGGTALNKPVVGMASTANGGGYWLVASDGGIFTFGNAGFYGSKGGELLNQPIVAMAATPSGKGYWLVASDGGIFSFGDATFYGSKGGTPLNKPIVGMAVTPNGGGYWMVASDGGIFTFGNASFYGSTGGRTLNGAIVGMGRTPTGTGYWLTGSDGAVFAFGDAKPLGSMAGKPLNAPIVGMAAHPG